MSVLAVTSVAAQAHTFAGTVIGWLADDATPSPDPAFNPDTVTPGTIGFIVTFGVMVLAVLLIIDMVRRIRRVNMRQQVAEKLDAEEAARAAADRGPGAKPKK